MTSGIRGLIRDGKTHQIDNDIARGGADGMISMDNSIVGLYKAGKISKETALDYCDNLETVKRKLN